MGLLTRVARGIAYGDVSNSSIRNILTEISKSIAGGITEQEMEDTLDYFDWKCPYTGRDLRQSIVNKDGSYATDHIYPQNRVWCGLNVKGNLIIVAKEANSAKKGMDVKTFFEEDSKFWDNLGVNKQTRLARLQKIRDFQKQCGYDPDQIRNVVSPLMEVRYDEVRIEQEKCIKDTLDALKKINIHVISKEPISTKTKTAKSNLLPELIFNPSEEKQFKNELLKSKKAHFILTYISGKKVKTPWNAQKFKETSDLKGNIESKTFWRNKNKEGLVKVEVFIN